MTDIKEKIQKLKEERDAVILAHYYVADEVQDIADYVGDSFYLSKIATQVPQKVILFCGVSFMGESAKILNPQKKVIMPDISADCPMAHMADPEKIKKMREQYDDLAVVCYINSTAELKTCSDVCVTSSNALNIVKALPNKNIYFIPDENLGRYVAGQVPEKNIILNDGFCHVHTNILKENLIRAKRSRPEALVLAHPECSEDILEMADYTGSTAGIIDFATESGADSFIICTETGVLHELEQKNPHKQFYSVGLKQFCPNMKKITLDKVADALEKQSGEVKLEEEIISKAKKPLERMLELAQ